MENKKTNVKEYFTPILDVLLYDRNLKPVEFKIMCYLIKLSDSDCMCFPSFTTITKTLNISQETFNKAKKNLVKKGYLLYEKRTTGKGKTTSNVYYINEKYLLNKNSRKNTQLKEIEWVDYDWLSESQENKEEEK